MRRRAWITALEARGEGSGFEVQSRRWSAVSWIVQGKPQNIQ
jgi:hypothetical protein